MLLKIGDIEFQLNILRIPQFTCEILLGNEFFIQQEAIMDWKRKELRL